MNKIQTIKVTKSSFSQLIIFIEIGTLAVMEKLGLSNIEIDRKSAEPYE